MLNKTKTDFLIDFTIFISFLVAGEPAVTGLPVHEWLSLALIAALVTHLVLHWDWIVSVTLRFFRMLFHESRFNYLVDFLVFLAMITVMLSGLLISRTITQTLGIQFQASPAWRQIHSLSADASLLLIGLHFAMHWKWIVSTVQRYVLAPFARRSEPLSSQPASSQENN